MCSLQPPRCSVHELYGKPRKTGLEAEMTRQKGLVGQSSILHIAAEDLVSEPKGYCHFST